MTEEAGTWARSSRIQGGSDFPAVVDRLTELEARGNLAPARGGTALAIRPDDGMLARPRLQGGRCKAAEYSTLVFARRCRSLRDRRAGVVSQ